MYQKLDEILSIVLEAGKAIMHIYQSDTITVNEKKDSSPLTDADLASNQIITNRLSEISEHPILSEEGKDIPFEIRKTWEQFWLVDPIDGTKEFINRNGEFTVNVAFLERINSEYIPTLGVVFAPALNKIYWNDEKHAYCAKTDDQFKIIQESIEIIQATTAVDPFKIVGSRSHSGPETETYITELKNIYKNVEFISMGSSLKLCLVAEGVANIYPRLGPTMEWDIAAAHAVCLKANCNVYSVINSDISNANSTMKYNKENLLNSHFIVK